MDYATLVVDDPAHFMFTDGYFLLGGGFLSTEQSFVSLRPSAADTPVTGLRKRHEIVAIWPAFFSRSQRSVADRDQQQPD